MKPLVACVGCGTGHRLYARAFVRSLRTAGYTGQVLALLDRPDECIESQGAEIVLLRPWSPVKAKRVRFELERYWDLRPYDRILYCDADMLFETTDLKQLEPLFVCNRFGWQDHTVGDPLYGHWGNAMMSPELRERVKDRPVLKDGVWCLNIDDYHRFTKGVKRILARATDGRDQPSANAYLYDHPDFEYELYPPGLIANGNRPHERCVLRDYAGYHQALLKRIRTVYPEDSEVEIS